MPYELLDHTADIGIRVTEPSVKALFETAARAMFDQIVNREGLSGSQTKEIQVNGMDREDLLINWLREILCLWTIEGRLIKGVRMNDISDTRLGAEVSYDSYDPIRHEILKDIKAVTYHGVFIAKIEAGWTTEIIFDV
jgi:SHS2 domain-containing protein